MKILLVIDHFGSGGAQRQMVNLACGLNDMGHQVDFFIYYPSHDFFRNELERRGIKIFNCPREKEKKGFSSNVLFSLRRLIKNKQYDVAISFLDTPSIYLLLAGFGSKTKLVVSDRNSYLKTNKYLLSIKRQLYRLADAVVANSYSQSEWLVKFAKLFSKKVFTIYNGYDTDKFSFSPVFPMSKYELKLIAIGRIHRQKNIPNLIKGLDLFYSKFGWCPTMNWIGRMNSSEYQKEILKLLDNKPHVKERWFWAGQRNDIPKQLSVHHALILPSLYEGLPNVICEAMLSGKPVLASNVCDNSVLVKEGERGFLFDPKKPEDICLAVKKLTEINNKEWMQFSINAHEFAITRLSLKKMIFHYEKLFLSL